MGRLPLEVQQKIFELRDAEKTDREIARILSINHKTVATYRQKNGLPPNGIARRSLKIIDAQNAECSRCHQIKPLANWPIARIGTESPYRLSYCRDCRRRQMTVAQNSSERTNLRIRWHRLRARCRKRKILCTIDFNDFWGQWQSQGGTCFYTDAPLVLDYGNGTQRNCMSVDKVEPDKGYVSGNVVFTTMRANTIKHDISLEEMALWLPGWFARVKAWQQ